MSIEEGLYMTIDSLEKLSGEVLEEYSQILNVELGNVGETFRMTF